MTHYRPAKELNDQQEQVMRFIVSWVKTQNVPTPKKEIVKAMKYVGMKHDVIEWAIDTLLAKGFIYKGYSEKHNETVYVQLRTLPEGR